MLIKTGLPQSSPRRPGQLLKEQSKILRTLGRRTTNTDTTTHTSPRRHGVPNTPHVTRPGRDRGDSYSNVSVCPPFGRPPRWQYVNARNRSGVTPEMPQSRYCMVGCPSLFTGPPVDTHGSAHEPIFLPSGRRLLQVPCLIAIEPCGY